MFLKTWQACVLSAGAVAGTLVLSTGNGTAAAQGGAAAPDARWHVAQIQRSGYEESERIQRDAVLVDGVTGQTWILSHNRGANPTWLPIAQKGGVRE
jgi:hypothetical protein